MFKNKLLKTGLIVAIFMLGIYFIETIAPWQKNLAQGFTLNFILKFFLFLVIGFLLGADSFVVKKFNVKNEISRIIVIGASLVVLIVFTWNWLLPQNMFGDYSWIKFSISYIENGLIVFFPILIGYNLQEMFFK